MSSDWADGRRLVVCEADGPPWPTSDEARDVAELAADGSSDWGDVGLYDEGGPLILFFHHARLLTCCETTTHARAEEGGRDGSVSSGLAGSSVELARHRRKAKGRTDLIVDLPAQCCKRESDRQGRRAVEGRHRMGRGEGGVVGWRLGGQGQARRSAWESVNHLDSRHRHRQPNYDHLPCP